MRHVPALLLLACALCARPGEPFGVTLEEARVGVGIGDLSPDEFQQELRLIDVSPWSPEGERELILEHPVSGIVLELSQHRTGLQGLDLVECTGRLRNSTDMPIADLHSLRALSLAIPAPDSGARFAYEPMEYSADTWYDSTYWTAGGWIRIGRDWHHPGEDAASARTFMAPRDGRIRITGRVRKAHLDGDGIRAAIRRGAETLWQAEIAGTDDVGVSHELETRVTRGDAIRFVVDKLGHIFCDTTYWEPVVTYEDGEQFVATDAFRDMEGLWRYEAERDLLGGGGAPTLHYPDPRMLWRSVGLPAGASVVLAPLPQEFPGSALPQFVLEMGRSEGLVVAALNPGPWRAACSVGPDGRLELHWDYGAALGSLPAARWSLGPGEAILLPRMVIGRYTGPWREGRNALLEHLALTDHSKAGETLIGPFSPEGGPEHGPALVSTYQEHGFHWSHPAYAWIGRHDHLNLPEPDLALQVMADWAEQDALDGSPEAYAQATADALARARDIVARLSLRGVDCSSELEHLAEISGAVAAAGDPRATYFAARWLKRALMLRDPDADMGELLFVKRRPAGYSHLVMQYFGWRAQPGGGLYMLKKPGLSLEATSLLPHEFARGSVLAPCVSWDGRRVLFSYSSCEEPDPFFHLYEVGLDGSGLRQLTFGDYEDLMPVYLPDGGIMFCSTRRQGYARCFGAQFGERWHVYTLHRMNADGSGIRTLSVHETNEWFPQVLPDGAVMYARWDYVDRHAVLHQNLWRTNPDGTNPVALYGNHTQNPHCSFEARPIPGSRKIMATASAHHSITAGSIITIDPGIDYDGPAPIERLTPEVPFPESEAVPSSYYAAPWPLSEDLFIAAYSPEPLIMEPEPNEDNALGLYLVDRWGNRELLVRDARFGCTSPIVTRPRPVPPVLPSSLPQQADVSGTYLLHDVYQGLTGIERGEVKRLRIVQVLPKSTPVADAPPVGLAGQEPTKMVLGSVPVEKDGSAFFTAPAMRPLLFQALDEHGLAIQTMRSASYLQPGESASCVGCHESRVTSPPTTVPSAARRSPSPIEPGPDGTAPFSYVRLVQPVLDNHCISCHSGPEPDGGIDLSGEPQGPWTRSYLSLTQGLSFYMDGTNQENATAALVPRFGGWNAVYDTPVGGAFAARGSRLIAMLRAGHGGVELPPEGLERLAIWIDANALFYGAYSPAEQARQLAGEVIRPPELQ